MEGSPGKRVFGAGLPLWAAGTAPAGTDGRPTVGPQMAFSFLWVRGREVIIDGNTMRAVGTAFITGMVSGTMFSMGGWGRPPTVPPGGDRSSSFRLSTGDFQKRVGRVPEWTVEGQDGGVSYKRELYPVGAFIRVGIEPRVPAMEATAV